MAKFVIDEAVNSAWGRLISDSSSTSWIACGYPEGSTNQLLFKGEGTGGMPEFIAKLPENDIVWGAIKVVAVDDRGNLCSRRPKFVSIKYSPTEGVPAMRRAKAGGHKGAVKQIMGSHVDIEVESKAEITEELIIQKLRACGGAHQPTSYEFSNYSGGSATSGASSPVPGARASPVPTPAAAPAPTPAPVAAPAPTPVSPPPAVMEEPVAAAAEGSAPESAPAVEEEASAQDEEVAAVEQEVQSLAVDEE